MKISIIIPVYNAEKTIINSVEALMSQNVDDIQLILVEDGSQDESWNICKKLCEKYANCILVHSNGKGPSAARNTGLLYTNGDIIGFCDADDYYEIDSLIKIKKIFQEHEELDIVISGFWYVFLNNGEAVRLKSTIGRNYFCSDEEALERILCDSNVMGSVWNKFYRRELLVDVRFDENLSYSEDTCFNVELLTKNCGCKCFLFKELLYNYVANETSLTHDPNRMYNDKNELKYNKSMYTILSNYELTNKQKSYVYRAIYKLSVVELRNKNIDIEKRSILFSEVKKTIFYFAINVYKYGIKHNCKMLIWGLIELIKGCPSS